MSCGGWHALFLIDLINISRIWLRMTRDDHISWHNAFIFNPVWLFWSKVWRNTLNVHDSKSVLSYEVKNIRSALLFSKYIFRSNPQIRTSRGANEMAPSPSSTSSCSSSPQDLLIICFLTCHHLSSYQAPFSPIVFL